MIRNAIPNTLIVVVFLLAPISANAVLWTFLDTAQNGAEGALGFGANVDATGGSGVGFKNMDVRAGRVMKRQERDRTWKIAVT